MGAALHFDTWVPNFGIQEYMKHAEVTDAVFPHDYTFREGRLYCGESAGHGSRSTRSWPRSTRTTPSSCRFARLEDGTMWDW
jgi:mannonate dehydratase